MNYMSEKFTIVDPEFLKEDQSFKLSETKKIFTLIHNLL